jgi:hypothetical protein
MEKQVEENFQQVNSYFRQKKIHDLMESLFEKLVVH